MWGILKRLLKREPKQVTKQAPELTTLSSGVFFIYPEERRDRPSRRSLEIELQREEFKRAQRKAEYVIWKENNRRLFGVA